MPQSSDPLNAYVEALDAHRKEQKEIDSDLRDDALAELQGLGAVAWPVEDGEWMLRAERDEQGAFIDASFQPA